MAVRQKREPLNKTGRELRKLFQEFNEKYFQGKLPTYHIRVVKFITWLGLRGRWDGRRRLIEIRSGINEAHETLLHEMIHAAIGNGGHGKKFWAEIKRLKDAGAKVAESDINTLELFPNGAGRLTQRLMKCHFEDALLDQPDAKFQDVVRWVIFSYGYDLNPSVAEFQRKYPKAKNIYRKCREERIEERIREEEFYGGKAKRGK